MNERANARVPVPKQLEPDFAELIRLTNLAKETHALADVQRWQRHLAQLSIKVSAFDDGRLFATVRFEYGASLLTGWPSREALHEAIDAISDSIGRTPDDDVYVVSRQAALARSYSLLYQLTRDNGALRRAIAAASSGVDRDGDALDTLSAQTELLTAVAFASLAPVDSDPLPGLAPAQIFAALGRVLAFAGDREIGHGPQEGVIWARARLARARGWYASAISDPDVTRDISTLKLVQALTDTFETAHATKRTLLEWTEAHRLLNIATAVGIVVILGARVGAETSATAASTRAWLTGMTGSRDRGSDLEWLTASALYALGSVSDAQSGMSPQLVELGMVAHEVLAELAASAEDLRAVRGDPVANAYCGLLCDEVDAAVRRALEMLAA